MAEVRPEAMVLLGATAAKALLGASFRVSKQRGELLDSDLAPIVSATVHPSAILRAPDDASRAAEREAFTRDLGSVAEALAKRR
jgi:uracil-DNA glycosylase family 4